MRHHGFSRSSLYKVTSEQALRNLLIEQRFGKHPLELVSDHAKVSVIHRGLLSLYLKQHAQEELLMDRHKNQQ